jgi:hypothetical protein
MAKDMTHAYLLSIVLIVAIVGVASMYSGGSLSDLTGMAITTDTDGDGCIDIMEVRTGTDPDDPDDCTAETDTDGDGISDRLEERAGTDPDVADTDGDGYDDGEEKTAGTDPLDADDYPEEISDDVDGDGIPNRVEVAHGTDPEDADTDGDGYDDGEEVDAGTDPLDADDYPMPDLVITGINYVWLNGSNGNFTVNFTVENIGDVSIDEMSGSYAWFNNKVDVEYEDPTEGSTAFAGTNTLRFHTYELEAGESLTAEIRTGNVLSETIDALLAGDSLDFEVDLLADGSYEYIDESDETNNEYSETVTLTADDVWEEGDPWDWRE